MGGSGGLQLREHTTTYAIELSHAEADALRETVRDLVVSPTPGRPGCFDVRPGSTIGLVHIGDLEVSIEPKVPIRSLLFMISYGLGPNAWTASAAAFEESDDLVEAVAALFVRLVSQSTGNGLLHGYERRDDSLPTVRGQIRFGDQISRRFGDRLPVEVAFDEFTADIAENQLLRAATDRLRRVRARTEATRRDLRSLDALFADVTRVSFERQEIPRIAWTRLNAHYRAAVELAQLILGSSSFELRRGAVRGQSLLIDMNVVFEDFVAIALGEALDVPAGEWTREAKGRGLVLDRAGKIRLRPDLSWWRDGGCVFVGDVKYKRLGSAGFLHPDVYQLLAYLTGLDLPAGWLIYPAGEATDETHEVSPTGHKLAVRTLSIDGTPPQMLEAVAVLADEISEALLAPPLRV